MKLSQLIRKREVATVTLATLATVTPIRSSSVASVNVATGTDGKPETLQDRQQDARRQKVIAMLEAAPGTQRAIYTDIDSDPHNVILNVAIRGLGTCELAIPKTKFDPWRLLELIERLGGRMSTDPSQNKQVQL